MNGIAKATISSMVCFLLKTIVDFAINERTDFVEAMNFDVTYFADKIEELNEDPAESETAQYIKTRLAEEFAKGVYLNDLTSERFLAAARELLMVNVVIDWMEEAISALPATTQSPSKPVAPDFVVFTKSLEDLTAGIEAMVRKMAKYNVGAKAIIEVVGGSLRTSLENKILEEEIGVHLDSTIYPIGIQTDSYSLTHVLCQQYLGFDKLSAQWNENRGEVELLVPFDAYEAKATCLK